MSHTTLGGRLGALLLLALLGAFVVPTTASAKHNLSMYKVEKHVDLLSEWDPDGWTLSCQDGDYALDGMWRVDHVDQDDDVSFNEQLKSIHPIWSYNVGDTVGDGNQDTWAFNFERHPIGKAQIKLFVTCLGAKTAENSHRHEFDFGPRRTTAYTAPYTGAQQFPHGLPCPAGYIAVAPGFKFTTPVADPLDTPGHGQIFRWSPDDIFASSNADHDNWQAGFVLDAGEQVELYQHCLKRRLKNAPAPTKPHRHHIVWRFKNATKALAYPKVGENRRHCGAHYKGVVGSFYFGAGDVGFTWYLGMDPRIKTRAFKFLATQANNVNLGLLCFHDQTT